MTMHDTRPHHDTDAAMREYDDAVRFQRDAWVAASGGTEEPVPYHSGWYLLVWNPGTGRNGLYRYADDTVVTDVADMVTIMEGRGL